MDLPDMPARRVISITIDGDSQVEYNHDGMSLYEAYSILYWLSQRMDVRLHHETVGKLEAQLDAEMGRIEGE